MPKKRDARGAQARRSPFATTPFVPINERKEYWAEIKRIRRYGSDIATLRRELEQSVRSKRKASVAAAHKVLQIWLDRLDQVVHDIEVESHELIPRDLESEYKQLGILLDTGDVHTNAAHEGLT
jgi:hypothetical protein